MGNENFEKLQSENNDLENLEKIKKALLKRVDNLDNELTVAEGIINEEKNRNESLKEQFYESQVALSQIKEIIDKLKISSPGIYGLSIDDEKYIQQIFYEKLN